MEITAKKREHLGKRNKKIRKAGLMPAVLFGKGLKSENLALDLNEFSKLYKQVGESALVNLRIGKEKPIRVLVSEVQKDPLTERFIHANLHKVDLTQKITTSVPISVIGQSEIIKSGSAILLSLIDQIDIKCLPGDLPKEIEVDISKLERIGDGILIKDLTVDREKIEILNDPDDLVIKADYAEQLEEEEEVSEEEAIASVEATEELSEEEKAKRKEEGVQEQDTEDKAKTEATEK